MIQPVDRMDDPPLPDCVFCKRISVGHLLLDKDNIVVFRDAFPVSPGHIHVVPRRHEEDFFELAPYERDGIWDTLVEAVAMLDEEYSPDGYNIGINVGGAAGQSVPHTSAHIIPRYKGDGEAAGIRWILGGKKSSYKKQGRGCHFCKRLPSGEGASLLDDGSPVVPGHCHVVPRSHTASFLDLHMEERDEALDLLAETVEKMQAEENAPDGYNIGINIGEAAGQSVPHSSLHIIPRRWGDSAEEAGLRWVRGGQQADVDRHE